MKQALTNISGKLLIGLCPIFILWVIVFNGLDAFNVHRLNGSRNVATGKIVRKYAYLEWGDSYWIEYDFMATQRTFHAKELTDKQLWDRLAVNSDVKVAYVNEDPSISILVGNSQDSSSSLTLVVLFGFLLFAFCLTMTPLGRLFKFKSGT